MIALSGGGRASARSQASPRDGPAQKRSVAGGMRAGGRRDACAAHDGKTGNRAAATAMRRKRARHADPVAVPPRPSWTTPAAADPHSRRMAGPSCSPSRALGRSLVMGRRRGRPRDLRAGEPPQCARRDCAAWRRASARGPQGAGLPRSDPHALGRTPHSDLRMDCGRQPGPCPGGMAEGRARQAQRSGGAQHGLGEETRAPLPR